MFAHWYEQCCCPVIAHVTVADRRSAVTALPHSGKDSHMHLFFVVKLGLPHRVETADRNMHLS